jgi:hypothetical protein
MITSPQKKKVNDHLLFRKRRQTLGFPPPKIGFYLFHKTKFYLYCPTQAIEPAGAFITSLSLTGCFTFRGVYYFKTHGNSIAMLSKVTPTLIIFPDNSSLQKKKNR